ncbi:MAG: ABC transporter permease [Polyangiaceae bacterium]
MIALLRILSAVRLALFAVARAKLRAALTILGILIGVAAVVIVTALGSGARDKIAKQIESMGSNVLYVFPQSSQASGARNKGGSRLTESDARAIVRDSVSVAAVAVLSSTAAQVVFGDRNAATAIYGTNLAYFHVRSYSVAKGAQWTEWDERSKAKVVILGATTAETLFGNQDPIGAVVRIGRYPFRVIGVLDRKGPNAFGEDQDDRVLMPAASFRARIKPTAPGRVDMLMVSASDANTVDRAQSQITSVLRQRHRIEEGRENDFQIATQADFRRSQEAIYAVLSILLLSVAGVSLFVGGIGVMNIMLVSVTERTREIGIRMAIGASGSDILIQFLVEAVVLSLLGGIIGTLVGVSGIYGFSLVLEWPMVVPVEALTVALGVSAAIGVVFGFLPARRAARLDPIDALRDELRAIVHFNNSVHFRASISFCTALLARIAFDWLSISQAEIGSPLAFSTIA